MNKTLIGALLLSTTVSFAQDVASTLDAAAQAMGVTNLTSIEYKGSGSANEFGQAINAHAPWPQLSVKSYTADINYSTSAWRQEIYRVQPDGNAPFGGYTQIQFVKGNEAWNLSGNPPAPVPAPAAVANRQLEILLTPAGFIKGAQANRAKLKGKVITFMTPDHHKIEGTLDAHNMIVKTETWVDSPVLGDMPVEMTFSNYKDFNGVKFPTVITQSQGGHPVLAIMVSEVKPNEAVAIDAPSIMKDAKVPALRVISEKVGDGIWYLTGGSHNSLVAEFSDHIVLIESPLDEARASAVITEAHKLVPNKPIKYVVNTHNHFDHLGGIRTAAAEGAIVITPASNKAYYEKIFANPHTLNPDNLAKSRKKVSVEGVQTKRVLSDGTHEIDLYAQPIDGHNDSMLLIYFPKDKILAEADAFPVPPNPAHPAMPNPWSVQLYGEIQQLKLEVEKIAPLHSGMSTLADLQKVVGKSSN